MARWWVGVVVLCGLACVPSLMRVRTGALRAEELDRGAKVSRIRIVDTGADKAAPAARSRFLTRACYEVAKARHREFFIELKSWDDPVLGHVSLAGFTNQQTPDLAVEFGPEFRGLTLGSSDALHYFSVKSYAGLFEAEVQGISDP